MSKQQLRAIAVFVAMIALPIVADNFISRRPDIPLFQSIAHSHFSFPLWLLAAIVILSGIGYGALRLWSLHQKVLWTAAKLTLAEHELNALIPRGRDQGGRIARVKERYEWNELDKWAPSGQLRWFGGELPDTNSIAKEFIRENEKEAVEQRQMMGRIKVTAFLLRELLNASPGNCISKIRDEQRMRGGELPFIATGLWDLLGAREGVDPSEWSPVHWRILEHTVRKYGFPRELVMTKKNPDGTLYEVRGMTLLEIINAQVKE